MGIYMQRASWMQTFGEFPPRSAGESDSGELDEHQVSAGEIFTKIGEPFQSFVVEDGRGVRYF